MSDLARAAGLLEAALARGRAAPLLRDLALVRLRQRRDRDALALLDEAARAAPDDAAIRANLGLALHRLGRLQEASACYRAALAAEPDLVNTRSNLASALKDAGDMPGAVAEYERAIASAPADLGLVSNLLWTHCHREDLGAAELTALHRRWGERFDALPHVPAPPPAGRPQRLRLGFVSADLRDHAAAFFLEPLWDALDRSRFAIHAYACSDVADAVTARLRRSCDGWVDAARLDDEALAARIRADGIHVLFDLSGHTAGNRLPVFARRAAPVQATWIGYPCTTGLARMDYLLSDEVLCPAGSTDAGFTEKVVRLPGAVCYRPPGDLPAVRPLPALARGHLTFGSFHRPAKLGERTLQAWSALLRQLPTARLLLGHCDEEATRDALRARFASLGVDAGRLDFRPRLPLREYLDLHGEVDLALDALSFSGGTTTAHALFMGVPVIAAMGSAMPQRQSGAILAHAGLGAFVAASPEAFAEPALAWAGRLDELAALRGSLRKRLLALPLQAESRVPRAFEAAVDAMWERHAAGLPPAALDVPAAGQVLVRDPVGTQ